MRKCNADRAFGQPPGWWSGRRSENGTGRSLRASGRARPPDTPTACTKSGCWIFTALTLPWPRKALPRRAPFHPPLRVYNRTRRFDARRVEQSSTPREPEKRETRAARRQSVGRARASVWTTWVSSRRESSWNPPRRVTPSEGSPGLHGLGRRLGGGVDRGGRVSHRGASLLLVKGQLGHLEVALLLGGLADHRGRLANRSRGRTGARLLLVAGAGVADEQEAAEQTGEGRGSRGVASGVSRIKGQWASLARDSNGNGRPDWANRVPVRDRIDKMRGIANCFSEIRSGKLRGLHAFRWISEKNSVGFTSG